MNRAQSIVTVLQYHKKKLKNGLAECLLARNFLKEAHDLDFNDKLYQFQRLTSRNERVERNVLHLFLSFGKDEKVTNAQMAGTSSDLLDTLGFGDQPAIVYRHFDALHPHAHVVSSTIRPDGKAIWLYRADYYRLRPLTRSLEEKYGLQHFTWENDYQKKYRGRLEHLKYGEDSLYPAMKATLDKVLPEYRYTTLDELNAILGIYNIQACKGGEDSLCYQRRGLYYRVLTDDGDRTGVWYNASHFDNHPGLDYLEARFSANRSEKPEQRRRLTGLIDLTLAGAAISPEAFDKTLLAKQIGVVRHDREGLPGIWFVDHQSKTVYDGRRLGPRYTAESIDQRCVSEETYRMHLAQEQQLRESRKLTHSLHL